MKWILENFGLVVVLALAAFSLLRTVFRTLRGGEESAPMPAPTFDQDPEEAERTRRIQEEIRRKIAERQGRVFEERETNTVPVGRENAPPLMPVPQPPPLDPLNGPMRRFVRKLEEASERSFPQADPAAEAAALERQRKLEQEIRALEAARAAELRRAEEVARRREQRTQSATGPIVVGRRDLRQQLRDPAELKRVILLREVLGPPVGLR